MRARRTRALRGVSFRAYEGAGSTRKRVQEPKVVTASIWGPETGGRVRARVSRRATLTPLPA
jgi:hypothetical protein